MTADLKLQQFLPFRLNRVAAEVSNALSETYRTHYALDIPQWRVMATLGADEPLYAQDIVRSTRTHKSTISRAVAELVDRGLVERVTAPEDARAIQLRLTAAGRDTYAALVPVVLGYERQLLDRLGTDDQAAFLTGLANLERTLGLIDGEGDTP